MAVIEDPANKDPENGDPSGTPGGSTGGGGTPKTPAPPIAPPPSPTTGHHPATAPFVPTSGHKATITDPPIPKGRGVRPGPPTPPAPKVPDPPTGGPPPTDTVPTTVTVDLPSRTSVFKPTPDNPLLPLYGPFGKVGAQLVYDKVQIDGSCVSAWVISYRCSSLTNIMVDGALITTFTGQYEIHLGDPSTDPAHAILHAAEPTIVSAIWQPAVAMVVARFPPITAANPKAPDTTRFQCDGVGMPLRDHRQDASLVARFSNIAGNFALQTADFLADPNFGANRPLAEVFGNTTLLDEAADDCDHIIDGGTTKRYSGGMQLQPQYVDQQINFMRAHFAGNVSFNNGVFNIWVEKARSAVAMSLTSEGASANILSAGPWEYPGRKQTTTRYRINFVNVDAGFKDDTVASDDPLLASNGVVFVETVLTCGFITKDIATRLANQYRKDLSLGQGTWVRLNAEWLQLLPGVRLPLTSDQLNTSAADMRVTDVRSSSQDAFPTMGEVYVKPYSAAIYDDTKVTATATIPPFNPTPYVVPPDIVSFEYDDNFVIVNNSSLWFQPPATLDAPLYASGLWSSSGITSFDATKINNGSTSDNAGTVSGSGGSVTLDLGAGSAKDFRSIAVYHDSVGTASLLYSVSLSDDGSSFTAVSGVYGLYPHAEPFVRAWTPVSPHRYIRITFPATESGKIINEIQINAATFVAPSIKRYLIFSTATGSRQLADDFSADAIPTLAKPYNIAKLITKPDINGGGYDVHLDIDIVAVTSAGVPSAGFSVSAQWFALGYNAGVQTDTPMAAFDVNGDTALRHATYAPTSGNNNNVALPAFSTIYLTGSPGGTVTLTGFSGGQDGIIRKIYNGTNQNVNITHDDGASSATNRCYCPNVSTVALVSFSSATIQYIPAVNRWLVS